MKTKGWQSVFRFTLVQYIKTKSFIIGTIIMCVIAAAVCVLTNVLPVVLGADDAVEDIFSGNAALPDDGQGAFSTVYFSDKAGILDEKDIAALAKLTCELKSAEDFKNETEAIVNGSTQSADEAQLPQAFLEITTVKDDSTSAENFSITVIYTADAEDKAELLSELASELISRRNMLNLGISEEDYAQSQAYISRTVISSGSETLDIFTSMINYIVPMLVSLILFLLIFSYGSTVAQSIATEKTSRVMELLLTSIRPLAVVIGKVLAMGVVCLAQFALIVGVGGISLAVSAPFGLMGKLGSIMSSPEFSEIADKTSAELAQMGFTADDVQLAEALNGLTDSFSVLNIVLIVIVFLLGFLFFSLVAALVGASISRMEDLTAAMQPYSLMGVLGMYLAYFPVIFNIDALESGVASTNAVQIFSYYFPLSSPFALPSAIMLGTLGTFEAIIAVLILAAAVVLVALLVSKVYEAIILHNGSRLKFKDIIKLAKFAKIKK